MPSDANAILIRLFLSGPLLYIAVAMVTDPERFLAILHSVSQAIQTFQQKLNGGSWPTPSVEPESSAGLQRSLRLTGLAIGALGFLHLAGFTTQRNKLSPLWVLLTTGES